MRWSVLFVVVVLVIGMGFAEAKGVMNPQMQEGHGHGAEVAHNTSWVEGPKYYHHEYNYSYNTSCPSCEHHQYNHSYNHSQVCPSCNGTNKSLKEERSKKPVEILKNRFNKIRNHIKSAKSKYMSARAKYEELKHRGLKDPETFRYAKMFIGNGIEVAKGWIEMLMVQIQYANMGEDQKNRITVKLENCLGILEVLEDKINSSETPEELKANVKSLKDNWSEIMITVKSALGQLAVVKLENVLNRLENVTVKVESKIPENRTDLLELLSDCRQRIESAREKLESANEKFEAMESAENPNKLWLEGIELINEAKEQIRLAFKDLKKIYIELKVVS